MHSSSVKIFLVCRAADMMYISFVSSSLLLYILYMKVMYLKRNKYHIFVIFNSYYLSLLGWPIALRFRPSSCNNNLHFNFFLKNTRLSVTIFGVSHIYGKRNLIVKFITLSPLGRQRRIQISKKKTPNFKKIFLPTITNVGK